MVGLKDMWKAIKYPRYALVYAHGVYRNRVFGGGYGGIQVMDEDWDNLLILDACRYDLFETCNTIKGVLRAVRSRGSMTGDFMDQNFAGRSFPDTVYVSANPNPVQHDAEFHAVVPLWDEGWDEELHTVPPDIVVTATMKVAEKYPHKRILAHFLQPHYPWIGPEGRGFHEKHGYTSLDQPDNLWLRMRQGEVDSDAVWEVYRENLEVTLPHVERLVDALDGKTVVSSDHGNAFGEWQVYGHPPRIYIEPLLKVPWLVVDSESRREIVAGDRSEQFGGVESRVEERLGELGYKE